MWRILISCKCEVNEYKQFVNVNNINNCKCEAINHL
jgi:hypothetical protein